MLNALAPAEFSQNVIDLLLLIRRCQQLNVPVNNFAGGVAVEFLGAPVPTGDGALQGLAEDCVFGRLHDGSQPGAIFLGNFFGF